MAKYNDRAVARKLDALSRVERGAGTEYGHFWTNGHPVDVSTSYTGLASHTNAANSFFTAITLPFDMKVRAARFFTNSGNGSSYGRLYELKQHEFNGFTSGKVIDRSFSLSAISEEVLSVKSAPVNTLSFSTPIRLLSSKIYVLGVRWTYTTSAGFLTTTIPRASGDPHTASDSFLMTTGLLDTVNSSSSINVVPLLSVALLSEDYLSVIGS